MKIATSCMRGVTCAKSKKKNSADGVVLVAMNNLDKEDYLPIITYSSFKDKMLLIFDKNTMGECSECCVGSLSEDFKSPKSVINAVTQWKQKHKKKIVGIVGLDEEYKYAVSKALSERFKLAYYDQSVIDTIVDKYQQRQELDKHNVNVPRFQEINADGQTPITITFPNVLKIKSGISSMFVYLNNTLLDLERNLADFRKKNVHSYGTVLMLEEYVGGDEYSCDYIVEGSSVNVLRVVKKITNKEDFPFFEGFFLHNPDHTSNADFSLSELENFCSRVAYALSIERGVCMMDFKFYNDKLYVIETTIRPGVAQFIELMGEFYGYTSVDKLIQQILTGHVDVDIPAKNALVFYIATSLQGMITRFDTSFIEQNGSTLGVYKVCKYSELGQCIARDNNKSFKQIMLGHVVMNDVDDNKIDETIKKIRNMINIEIKPKCLAKS